MGNRHSKAPTNSVVYQKFETLIYFVNVEKIFIWDANMDIADLLNTRRQIRLMILSLGVDCWEETLIFAAFFSSVLPNLLLRLIRDSCIEIERVEQDNLLPGILIYLPVCWETKMKWSEFLAYTALRGQ